MSNKILKHAYPMLISLIMVMVTVVPFTVDSVYALDYKPAKIVSNVEEIHKNVVRKVNDIQEEQKRKEAEEKEAEEKAKKELTIEERIKEACEKYDIPFDITLAISRLETGWFKSDAYIYGNNPGGLSVNEQPIYFDTIDEGVERFVSNLADNYFAIGLDTPESIGEKYCPSNPEWSSLVRELMSYGY